MSNKENENKTYKTIGEVASILGLVDEKSGFLQTHTIRYWESRFKQIKPKVMAGRRRYYTDNDIKIISHIKYLLKEKGLTIKGVKKILENTDSHSLDDVTALGVYKSGKKITGDIKNKIKKIFKLVKELKKLKNG